MTRRQKGEGSIIKLPNGRFKVRIELEPADGKRKWLSRTVNTKTEAVATLKTLQRQKEDTKQLKKLTGDNTICSFIDDYLSYKQLIGQKDRTLLQAKCVLNKVSAYFKGIKVTQITTRLLQELIGKWKNQDNISDSSIGNYINTLNMFFSWLLTNQYLTCNPMAGIVFHKRSKRSKRNLVVLSSAEHNLMKETTLRYYQDFIDKHKTTMRYRFYPVYLLAYETGMREGELSGLKWSQVDLENHKITIDTNATISFNTGHVCESTPKSVAGFRDIIISEGTANVLKELREAYDEQGYTSVYVFPAKKDSVKPYMPSSLNGLLKEFLVSIGVTRHFTFHDLRHTNASLMIAADVDIGVITERLGHADISVTYKTYAHILQECEDKNKPVVIA